MSIRGLWTHGGLLYAIDGATFEVIDSNGVAITKGAINSTSGPIDFASNLTQLVVNDGSYLYVYTPSSGTFTTTTNYPGGDRIAFLDQRVLFQYRGTQKFGWTALGNASSIALLDFASAESSPDLLISILASNREVWLFGEESSEVWDSVGGTTVFSRSSAAIDYGCAAAQSAQKSANSVFWLSREKNGQAIVMSATGHQPRRISTRNEEEKMQGLDLSAASAFTYSDGGQSFYCLNVPGLDTTLVWDETFSQWHERAEWVAGAYAKWRPTCHAFAYGKHYFGGGVDLYRLDATVNKYGTDVKRRQRIAPVISKPSMGRVSFTKFEIICEKGTGAQIELRYSDDNGSNWSSWTYATVGQVGQFARRARYRRLGFAYDRVFDVVMTDDAPFNPVAVSIPL